MPPLAKASDTTTTPQVDSTGSPRCRDLPGFTEPPDNDTSWRRILGENWDVGDTSLAMAYRLFEGRAFVEFDTGRLGCWLEAKEKVLAEGVDEYTEPTVDPYTEAPGFMEAGWLEEIPFRSPLRRVGTRNGPNLRVRLAGRRGTVFGAGFLPVDTLASIPGQELLARFPQRFWICRIKSGRCEIPLEEDYGVLGNQIIPFPSLRRLQEGYSSSIVRAGAMFAKPLWEGGGGQDVSVGNILLRIESPGKGEFRFWFASGRDSTVQGNAWEVWKKSRGAWWIQTTWDSGKTWTRDSTQGMVALEDVLEFPIIARDYDPDKPTRRRCVNHCP